MTQSTENFIQIEKVIYDLAEQNKSDPKEVARVLLDLRADRLKPYFIADDGSLQAAGIALGRTEEDGSQPIIKELLSRFKTNGNLTISYKRIYGKFGWLLSEINQLLERENLGLVKLKQRPKSRNLDMNKPWWVAEPADPEPAQDWYIPARHFARRVLEDKAHLLSNRMKLASEVQKLFKQNGIMKRGNKVPHEPQTILKAFNNVNFN